MFILSFVLVAHLLGSYYNYEINSNTKTPYEVTWEEIVFWDKKAEESLKNAKEESYPLRLRAYLRNAERDFFELSVKLRGKEEGSVAPIASKIIALFSPDYPIHSNIKGLDDPYSNELAEAIFRKYKNRFEEEGELKPYVLNETSTSWKGTVPYYGLAFGNLKLWMLDNVAHYRTAKPPEAFSFWCLQYDETVRERSLSGPQEVAVIDYWAGPSGNYADKVDEYMYEKNVSLKDRVKIRAELAALTSDTAACMFDSKYTYLIKRPHMVNKDLKPVIECPNHPSYPSGHSTVSAMSAAFASYYFPENEKNWWRVANECGMSRIQGGLHFQIDHVGGQDQGTRIAEQGIAYIKKAKP